MQITSDEEIEWNQVPWNRRANIVSRGLMTGEKKLILMRVHVALLLNAIEPLHA